MHKICALTQCEVNYAPDNVYQSYEDSAAGSSPVRTVMTMNFTELTPILVCVYFSLYKSVSVRDLSAGSDPLATNQSGNIPNMSEDDIGY